MLVRQVYSADYDPDVESYKSGLQCLDASKTQQSDAKEADINFIVKQFGITGQVPNAGLRVPEYSWFENVFDFQTAMNAITQARAAFDALDPQVRLRFANDPQVFLEFCGNPENLDEMRKLGLAVPKVDPPPEVIQKVEIVAGEVPKK